MGRSKRKVYRMKLATRSVILALGVAGILSTGLPAHATAPALAVVSTPNTSDLDSVYDWYIEQGVDDATANTLVAKLRSGVLTDANTGATPTSVATDTSDGWQTTRSTYADGSISISKLQVASEAAPVADGVAPFSVGDCSQVVGGSGYAKYYACGVYESTDLLAMSFRADYTLTNAASEPSTTLTRRTQTPEEARRTPPRASRSPRVSRIRAGLQSLARSLNSRGPLAASPPTSI